MSKRIDLLGSVRNVIGGLFGVLGYFFRFAGLMLLPKAVLPGGEERGFEPPTS